MHTLVLMSAIMVGQVHGNPVFYEPDRTPVRARVVLQRFDVWDRASLGVAAAESARRHAGLTNAARRASVASDLVVFAKRCLGVPSLLDAESNIIGHESDAACIPFDRDEVPPPPPEPPPAAWHWVVIGGRNVQVWGVKDLRGMVHYRVEHQTREVVNLLYPPIAYVPTSPCPT